MTPEDREALLHQEIDGVNRPEDSVRLEAEIRSRPETRQQLEDLARLKRALENVKAVEPPTALTGTVMRSVRQGAESAPGLLDGLLAALGRRPGLAYAYVFGAGLVIGGSALALLRAPALDTSRLGGTLLPAPSAGREFSYQGIHGSESVVISGGDAHLSLWIESGEPAEVLFSFDPERLAVLGFTMSPGAGADVTLGREQVRLLHRGGATYRLTLEMRQNGAATVGIGFTAGGRQYQREIEVQSSRR